MHQPALRTATLQRHAQGPEREMPVVDGADGPSGDVAREQIEDHRQRQLAALANNELGRVADPPVIRRFRGELPLEQIRRDRLVVIAHRRAFEPLADARLQAVLLHQPDHALPTDALLLLE
jgi:hypothetical protein